MLFLFFTQRDTIDIFLHLSNWCVASPDFAATHNDLLCFRNVSIDNLTAERGDVTIGFKGAHSVWWLMVFQWRASILAVMYAGFKFFGGVYGVGIDIYDYFFAENRKIQKTE